LNRRFNACRRLGGMLLFLLASISQAVPGDTALVRPPRVASLPAAFRLDGRLDEAVWASAPAVDEFSVIEPDTLAMPPLQSSIRMFYTDRGLYVGFEAKQDPDTLVARLSPRDQRIARDSFSITIDPTGTGLFGYWFSVALGDSLADGTVLPERQFSNQWDGPWNGFSVVTEDGWTAELFLPWSMMAMPQSGDERTIAFYASRQVAYLNQRWGIPALPSTTPKFMSALRPVKIAGVEPSTQLTLYPFSAATYDAAEGDLESKIGSDIYWRPSSNLQVSGTLNPDFGTVQQDDLVVNLSAFEVFFSERRPFFLEGQEVFNTSPRSTGNYRNGPQMTLLNTRRIGAPPPLPTDDRVEGFLETDRNRLSDLAGAAKVTGQQGAFRFGALAALEQDTEVSGNDALGELLDFQVKGRRFGALRGLWESAAEGRYKGLGAMLTGVGKPGEDGLAGTIDGHLLSRGGVWKFDGQLIGTQAGDRFGVGLATDLVYTPKKGRVHNVALDLLDRHIDINDFGFLRRNDQAQLRYRYEETRSDLSHVRDRTTTLRGFYGVNWQGQQISSGLIAEREWTLLNLSRARVELGYRPARWDDRNSFGNGAFKAQGRTTGEFFVGTNESLPLVGGVFGGFEQETLQDWSYRGGVFMVWRPGDRFNARMRLEVGRRNDWILHDEDRRMTSFNAEQISPRMTVEYYFSARQQLRASMQWIGLKAEESDFYEIAPSGHLRAAPQPTAPGEQDFSISNAIMQLRYRWEIAPLSDLFVVYSRGGSLDNPAGRGFDELLRRNIAEPDQDQLVVMLRYRMGS
jgi:hypothetical protein